MSDKSRPKDFRPWPNGTSMMAWKDANCDRCAKVGEIDKEGKSACEIETALALSAIGPHAVHPQEAAEARRRLKWHESYLEHDCPEFATEEMVGLAKAQAEFDALPKLFDGIEPKLVDGGRDAR